jgi:hypothetical protein
MLNPDGKSRHQIQMLIRMDDRESYTDRWSPLWRSVLPRGGRCQGGGVDLGVAERGCSGGARPKAGSAPVGGGRPDSVSGGRRMGAVKGSGARRCRRAVAVSAGVAPAGSGARRGAAAGRRRIAQAAQSGVWFVKQTLAARKGKNREHGQRDATIPGVPAGARW